MRRCTAGSPRRVCEPSMRSSWARAAPWNSSSALPASTGADPATTGSGENAVQPAVQNAAGERGPAGGAERGAQAFAPAEEGLTRAEELVHARQAVEWGGVLVQGGRHTVGHERGQAREGGCHGAQPTVAG